MNKNLLGLGAKKIISTSIIITLIIGLIVLAIGYFTKKRWINLISIFILILGAWMLITELLTGARC